MERNDHPSSQKLYSSPQLLGAFKSSKLMIMEGVIKLEIISILLKAPNSCSEEDLWAAKVATGVTCCSFLVTFCQLGGNRMVL